jgi:outer membrane biosynthesis protein TonB
MDSSHTRDICAEKSADDASLGAYILGAHTLPEDPLTLQLPESSTPATDLLRQRLSRMEQQQAKMEKQQKLMEQRQATMEALLEKMDELLAEMDELLAKTDVQQQANANEQQAEMNEQQTKITKQQEKIAKQQAKIDEQQATMNEQRQMVGEQQASIDLHERVLIACEFDMIAMEQKQLQERLDEALRAALIVVTSTDEFKPCRSGTAVAA